MTKRDVDSSLPAVRPRRVRVIRSGRYLQYRFVPAGIAVLIGVGVSFYRADLAQEPELLIAAIPPVAIIVAAIRSLFLGVWLYDDRIVARTLWRTITVNRSELEGCFSISLSIIPSPKPSRGTRELQLDLLDDTQRRLGMATTTRARLSELQVRQVRAYIAGAPIEQTLAIARADEAGPDSRLSETRTGHVPGR
ncbi:hypothetical protein V6245_10680 [Salinibacterium amurskyense]|uniref:hypothetical protein n=1 Tax=Salinibacterium amurskyense TaxID=205941 RepID=UPI00311F601E